MLAQLVILHLLLMKFVVLWHFLVLLCFLFQSVSTLFQPSVASAKPVNHSHDNSLLLALTLPSPVGLTNPSALGHNPSLRYLLACILQLCSVDILEIDVRAYYKSNILQMVSDLSVVDHHA